MKNFFRLTLTAMTLVVLLGSCAKEGCTDGIADNFCEDCKKDDGSCTYSASVQFWYGQSTATNLVTDGSTSLTYYIDNTIVGSSAASVYYTGDPECGASGVVKQTKQLGKDKSKASTYKIVDDLGDVIWSGNATFDASKSCTSIQLTY
jgi:hypothetical protein